jgi:hypothetical protein
MAMLAFLSVLIARNAVAAGFYTWNGKSFSTLAPLPQNTGQGFCFNFITNQNVDMYGVPANLLLGGWLSTYVSNGGFYGPNGSKVAGSENGGNAWSITPSVYWFYPLQFDTQSLRVGFNAALFLLSAGDVGGPSELWLTPIALSYSYHQFRYLKDSTFAAPYISLPVGGGFGFTPANGWVNQYNFSWLMQAWYQLAHMDELGVGKMGLGWLDGVEFHPLFVYTHQLNATPNLPNTSVFGAGYQGAEQSAQIQALGLTPGATAGYMPADSIVENNVISYPLKNIFPGTWLANGRLGIMVDAAMSAFQSSYAGYGIKNAGVEMVSVGPGIQYAKGSFVMWLWDNQNVMTQNFYNVNEFWLQITYFFNL